MMRLGTMKGTHCCNGLVEGRGSSALDFEPDEEERRCSTYRGRLVSRGCS